MYETHPRRSRIVNRTIRLLVCLSGRRWLTIAELAVKFPEIGTKTIRRDLSALQSAGVPLEEKRMDISDQIYGGSTAIGYRIIQGWIENFK